MGWVCFASLQRICATYSALQRNIKQIICYQLHLALFYTCSLQPVSSPTQLMSPDARNERENQLMASPWGSKEPLAQSGGVSPLQPRNRNKPLGLFMRAVREMELKKDAEHERGFLWKNRVWERKQRPLCIPSSGCLWSADRGGRARAYGAHLAVRSDQHPAWWSRWPAERDAPGRTRAWREGSANRGFTHQPGALQSQQTNCEGRTLATCAL